MSNNFPIGVFDSGVGGLSVFSQLIKLLPNENYIYFGDTLNLPYGDKSQEELVQITRNIFEFFKLKNVKAVVMACNTTSAMTYDILKNEFDFKIYPIVQNVAKQIAEQNYDKIGVFATQGTINSHAYKNEIQKYNINTKVFEIACPKWVNFVENKLQYEEENIQNIKDNLDKMLKNSPDKIILGCTHYPYLLNVLSKFAPENLFINPAKYFSKFIYQDLKNNNLLNTSKSQEPIFCVSSNPKQFISSAELFYKVKSAQEILLSFV